MDPEKKELDDAIALKEELITENANLLKKIEEVKETHDDLNMHVVLLEKK